MVLVLFCGLSYAAYYTVCGYFSVGKIFVLALSVTKINVHKFASLAHVMF